jgi:hypothetical protein
MASSRITSGQGVAVPTPGRCDHALVTQSTGTRAAVGPHPGFQVNFGFRLVGMWMPLLVITRGTSSSLAPGSLAEHRHVAGGRA